MLAIPVLLVKWKAPLVSHLFPYLELMAKIVYVDLLLLLQKSKSLLIMSRYLEEQLTCKRKTYANRETEGQTDKKNISKTLKFNNILNNLVCI